LELCLSKFDVGIWSYKWGVEGRKLFVQFIGKKKRIIEKRDAFFGSEIIAPKRMMEKSKKT
jgi:hypothetical protein